jgi:predicted nucleotidyltransferase
MAEIPDIIRKIINKFIIESEKISLHIQKIILFGSYAKGNYNEWSDIDIAVISDNFDGIRYYDNMKLNLPVIRTSSLLETHPYRPEDFTQDDPFVKEILKNGILVYSSN